MYSKIIDSLVNAKQIENISQIRGYLNETDQFYSNNSSTRFYQTNPYSETNRVTYKTGYIFAFGFLFVILLLGIVGRASYSVNDTLVHLNYMKYQRNSLERSNSNSRNVNRRPNS